MSVYNRKSWYSNGTKHWIHNGRHYHKKIRHKLNKRKSNSSAFFKKYSNELNSYIENFRNGKKRYNTFIEWRPRQSSNEYEERFEEYYFDTKEEAIDFRKKLYDKHKNHWITFLDSYDEDEEKFI